MKIKNVFTKISHLLFKDNDLCFNQLQAGTGFMICLSETINEFQKRGYTYNFVPQVDHFTCCDGKYKIYPEDFFIDDIFRFENSSDPDDQSILYILNCQSLGIKGLYVESYGVYHDELSARMLERIKYCRKKKTQNSQANLALNHFTDLAHPTY